MPMPKWGNSSKGLVYYENGGFGLGFDVSEDSRDELFDMTEDICAYRLHVYFERKQR